MSRIVERNIDENKADEPMGFGKVEGLSRDENLAKLASRSEESPITVKTTRKSESNAGPSGCSVLLLRLIAISFLLGLAFFGFKFLGNPFAGMFDRDANYSPNQGQLIELDRQEIISGLQSQKEALNQLESKVNRIEQNQVNRFDKNDQRMDAFEDRLAELETSITKLTETVTEMEIRSHTVKRGDTLWRISNFYYGSSQYIDSLARYNNLVNPRLIVSGSKLLIPPVNQLK